MWNSRGSTVLSGLCTAAVALSLLTGPAVPSQAATQDGLTIPDTHPRLWWNAERLALAKQWWAAHKFTPRDDDAFGNAFRYVMTSESLYAQRAITKLMNFYVPQGELDGTISNTYRWADWVPVVFDWTYDVMTPDQRTTFMTRYNGYVDIMRQKGWGGLKQPSSNYYWGYLRNELNWAIATYHDNDMAPAFLDHALVARWGGSFQPWAASGGRGGIPNEGSQYGRYMLSYPVVPFVSAGLLGRELFSEGMFHKEAVMYMIYTTSPAGSSKYDIFPYSDDEFWRYGGNAEVDYFGDFMTAAAMTWKNLPIGQYARRWLNLVTPDVSNHVKAVDAGGPELPLTNLPLDYYSPGTIGFLFARNSWQSDATLVHLFLGVPSGGASHAHEAAGTFQIRRGAKWVSRSTVGYTDKILGYNGSVVTVNKQVATNAIIFNGKGQSLSYEDGPPKINRLESRANYAYADVDLSLAYRAHKSSRPDRDDNPYVKHAEREFLFIRPLETLVVFDRMESSSEKIPAADVAKTFLAHFELPPVIDGPNSVLGVNGTEALRLITLVPSAPTYRVINEKNFLNAPTSTHYQYRLEVDTKGSAQGYFLHLLQSKGALDPDIQATVAEDAGAFTVTITHPTKGGAVVVFNKGMVSSGGGVGYAASGLPSTVTPLTAGVQGIKVTDNGPVWDGMPEPSPAPAPIAPTVSLTAPSSGASLSGPVTVSATASDDKGVAGVQFLLDGSPLGAEDLTNTFSVSWDTLTALNGSHVLTAIARNVDGYKTTSSPVTVSVSNVQSTNPPVISGITVSGITASAATVGWTTDVLSDSLVEYGTTTAYGSAKGDGQLVTSHSLSLSQLAAETLYHYRVRSADLLGKSAVSADATFTTGAASPAAFQEANGQVVMEAEHYSAKVARNSQDWLLETAQSGFSGTAYVEALANIGKNIGTNYVTTSPEVVYRVQFTTPGTYYVWVRGFGATDQDDSVHAGIDGTGSSTADTINLSTKSKWGWTRTAMDGSSATIKITSPGLHTIHLWMREDGFKIDKILLRTNSSSTAPSGSGPAESPSL